MLQKGFYLCIKEPSSKCQIRHFYPNKIDQSKFIMVDHENHILSHKRTRVNIIFTNQSINDLFFKCLGAKYMGALI